MVQSLANLPVPTPAPDQAIRIQIPALNIDAPIVQGDGWEQLKKGVGQNIGSANPGQNGNVVLSAHNDVYGELFRYLDKLVPGDQVVLYTQQRQYVYVVDRTSIVEPTAVEVMASTGSPTTTLISCYPYLVNKERIVVFARLQNWHNKGIKKMAKKSKRTTTTVSMASTPARTEFKPDYTYVKRDLTRIAILAGFFIIVLVVLSFFLR
jgi:LPXTG-site transpeptidase (sortase) family protein